MPEARQLVMTTQEEWGREVGMYRLYRKATELKCFWHWTFTVMNTTFFSLSPLNLHGLQLHLEPVSPFLPGNLPLVLISPSPSKNASSFPPPHEPLLWFSFPMKEGFLEEVTSKDNYKLAQ